MNYRYGTLVTGLLAVLSYGQTPATKPKLVPLAAKPDNWQKSKECAEQAEKVIVDQKGVPPVITSWKNHYSLKYNRCFISILDTYSLLPGAGKDFDKYYWRLLDAFERSEVAATEWDGPPPSPNACRVEGESVDCDAALNFIREHLKH